MPTVTVNSEAEAAAYVLRLELALKNMIPFFQKLEEASGALDVAEREVWDRRFGTSVRHAPGTIKARSERSGYYEANQPSSRATSSSPFFEWTGSLRQAASRWTTLAPDRAVIDPDKNYEGPLEGVVPNPFSNIVGKVFDDAQIWDEKSLGARIERDLVKYLTGRLEGRAVGS